MAGEILKILKISLKNQAVTIGDEVHPFSIRETPFKPNTQYKISPYAFLDSKNKESNGSVFEILPFETTSIMEITDQNLVCQTIAVEGNGYCLRLNLNDPNRKVEVYSIDTSQEENPLIELSFGSVVCFIAGKDGLKVAEVSTPKFNRKIGRNVSLYDKRLPPEFTEMKLELSHDKMAEYVHEHPTPYLARTLEYFRMVHGSPESILNGNPGKTIAELMTNEEIADYMRRAKNTAEIYRATINKNPHIDPNSISMTRQSFEDYLFSLKYLKKINRLPEEYKGDYSEEFKTDSLNNP